MQPLFNKSVFLFYLGSFTEHCNGSWTVSDASKI